ncbi:hypothetical protein XocVXO32_23840, partial [Xanthomonas oryzae pv. oryzicola]
VQLPLADTARAGAVGLSPHLPHLPCRIFQEESVPDIVAQIVQEHRASNPPIAASFRLDQQLRQRRPPEVAYCHAYSEDM